MGQTDPLQHVELLAQFVPGSPQVDAHRPLEQKPEQQSEKLVQVLPLAWQEEHNPR